jgi:hypothetical protein
MNVLHLIGRDRPLFEADIARHEVELSERVAASRFLLIGGAGSIGQAVAREIFRRNPRTLHVVISQREQHGRTGARPVRSTLGYIDGDFSTFAIDCGSPEFRCVDEAWSGGYDYVLNLSALKHVRSEKDPFTLMRMVDVNVLNTISTIGAGSGGAGQVFLRVHRQGRQSGQHDGSQQTHHGNVPDAGQPRVCRSPPRALPTWRSPTAACCTVSTSALPSASRSRLPRDVRRYFVTPQESGELCLMSCLLGDNRDIFFPKLSEKLHLITFSDIAVRIPGSGLATKPTNAQSEDEARDRAGTKLIAQRKWPCYFFASDTTGEKDFEEFLYRQGSAGYGALRKHRYHQKRTGI